MSAMHIGFLFNHYGGHQVAHALPVALALLRRGTNAKVSVLVSEDCESEVRRMASATPGPAPEIIRLRPPSRIARAANRASGRAIPADILSTLHRNLDRFLSG